MDLKKPKIKIQDLVFWNIAVYNIKLNRIYLNRKYLNKKNKNLLIKHELEHYSHFKNCKTKWGYTRAYFKSIFFDLKNQFSKDQDILLESIPFKKMFKIVLIQSLIFTLFIGRYDNKWRISF